MDRRTYLVTAGSGASALLAGCLSDDSSDTEPDGDDETDPAGDESGTDSEPNPDPVIESYLEAAQAEDPDAMAAVVHSASPLQGLLTDPEWEFESSGTADLDALETEVVTADGSVDDVRELEGAEFWFSESDLEAEIDDAEIMLVRAELDGAAAGDGPGVYALVTEGDEWKIFWVESGDDTPDDPEDAFEPEIIDTDDAVVERIEWGVDAVDAPDGSDVETGYYARVHLTDEPGREADLIRIESTIASSTFEFYGESKDEPSTSWAGSWANVQLDSDGDQIVVTAVRGDTETVVHREHYEPSD
ncbi:hypothetical protein HTG_07850 [Natrinema mahii]|nr:hypothetical protein HTG_07850 [Natrinema mahii]